MCVGGGGGTSRGLVESGIGRGGNGCHLYLRQPPFSSTKGVEHIGTTYKAAGRAPPNTGATATRAPLKGVLMGKVTEVIVPETKAALTIVQSLSYISQERDVVPMGVIIYGYTASPEITFGASPSTLQNVRLHSFEDVIV